MDDNYQFRSLGGAPLTFRAKGLPGGVLMPVSAPAGRDGEPYAKGNPLCVERDDDFVMAPFWIDNLTLSGDAAAATLRGGQYGNIDGTASALRVSGTISATGASGGVVGFRFRGNVLGLRWRPAAESGETTIPPIGLLIDRQAFEVPVVTPKNPLTAAYAPALGSPFTGAIVARDLGDGEHYAEIVLPGSFSGSARKWELYGYVVEAKAGYRPPTRLRDIGPPAVVAATTKTELVAYSLLNIKLPFGPSHRGLMGLILDNPTGADITLQLFRNSVDTTPFRRVKTPSGESRDVEFMGGPIWGFERLHYQASATGLVITPVGEL